MTRYVLTRRAEQELGIIYDNTYIKFGIYQAEAYHAGFERIFSLLAQFPRMGVSTDELAIGLRRFQFQSHYVFYSEAADHILIRALIHIGADIRPALFR